MILLIITSILFFVTSCANPPEDLGSKDTSADSETNTPPPDSDTEPSEEPPPDNSDEVTPILADLDNDGTDDEIQITYDDDTKSSATIKVINGKTSAEMMTDTLALNTNETGAYYLQIGKGVETDKLVFWSYSYLDGDRFSLKYTVFSYTADGNISYGDRSGKTFNIFEKAAVAAANNSFIVMRETLNELIMASRDHYDGYLLLDNQGDELKISTADNMLAPTYLEFELWDFFNETDSN